jgi:PhnB protein
MAAGADSIMPCEDMFYGDRHGGVMDPFGNIWWIATHIEDVDGAELQKRAAQFEADQQQ